MGMPTALPVLRGRWLVALRVLWTLLLLAAALNATWGAWSILMERSALARQAAGVGFALEQVSDGYMLRPLTEEIRQAGAADYDDLTAINGEPAGLTTDDLEETIARLEGPVGARVTLSLEDETGEARDVVVERSPRHLEAADQASPLPVLARAPLVWFYDVLTSVVSIVTAWMMFRRRPGDPVASMLSVAILLLSSALGWSAVLPAAIAGDVYSATYVVGVSLLIGALLVFPSGQIDSRLVWIGAVLILAAGAVEIFLPYEWILIQSMWALALAGCAAAVIRRYVRNPPGPLRQQMKWSLLGLVLYAVFNGISVALLWLQSRIDDIAMGRILELAAEAMVVLSFIILLIGLLVSMLRHRLYDADAAISRSFSVGAVTLAVVGIFAGAEKLVELVGEQVLGAGAASAIAAAMAAMVVLPLHNRLSTWAERRFQSELARLRRDLPREIDDLRDFESPKAIADVTVEEVMRAVRARRAAVITPDAQGWSVLAGDASPDDISGSTPDAEKPLSVDKNDPAYPVRVRLEGGRASTSGWLLIGPRPDGSVIGRDERDAIGDLAAVVGRALHVALRRQETRAETEARFEQLESRIAAKPRRRRSSRSAPRQSA